MQMGSHATWNLHRPVDGRQFGQRGPHGIRVVGDTGEHSIRPGNFDRDIWADGDSRT